MEKLTLFDCCLSEVESDDTEIVVCEDCQREAKKLWMEDFDALRLLASMLHSD